MPIVIHPMLIIMMIRYSAYEYFSASNKIVHNYSGSESAIV